MKDREAFILENMGLVGMVASRYRHTIWDNPALDYGDLVNIGSIGLINACDRYNPKFNVKFSTYATCLIEGEVTRFLRDRVDLMRPPRYAKSIMTKILKAGLLNESPIVISKLLDIPINKVETTLNFNKQGTVEYFASVIYESEGTAITLADKIGVEPDMAADVEVEQFIKRFDEQTQRIIKLRMLDLRQAEIGDIIGVSPAQVSRILVGVKKELRRKTAKKRNWKLAVKLAKETDLTADEIMKRTGISQTAIHSCLKNYRVTEQEIAEIEKRIAAEAKEPPVKTYTLTPDELEKYKKVS